MKLYFKLTQILIKLNVFEGRRRVVSLIENIITQKH